MEIVKQVAKHNTIITSASGGGSTTFTLYLANFLTMKYNVLYFNTGNNIDINFVKNYYKNVYDKCTFINSTHIYFFEFISELGSNLKYIDYIIIDTADTMDKKVLHNLNSLLEIYDVKLISTSQIRVNPNTSKPYSTVEEWNKQLPEKIFTKSIWIRDVNTPNDITKQKYIDIYNYFRIGNKYDKRFILNFDKKRGNIL